MYRLWRNQRLILGHSLVECIYVLMHAEMDSYRKVIRLDGCFLKGSRRGELLAAIWRDENNKMFQ